MSTDAFEYKAASISSATSGKSGALNLDEAQGIVECFVAGIGNKDSVGDIVQSGAFTKSLMRRKPRVVWGHNWNDPIGKVLEIYEVPSSDPRLPLKMKMAGIGGLFARVQFNLNSEKGREAFANVAFFGEEQEWSIGYKTLRAQYDQKSQANIIYELELYEVSPVLHGANQLTGTISVKAGMPGSPVMEQLPVAQAPAPQIPQMQEEIEQALQKMMGGSISVTEVDEENGMVSFNKPGDDNATDKYKCNFSRGNNGQFMFGAPERIVVIAKPPVAGPGMPGVEPQRIVRPSQMPSIPVAIKPGPTGGMTVVPLPPVQYEGGEQKPVDKESLDQEESDLRDALLKIVKRHGKINEDADGIWAGYKPAMQNPVAGIGVKCANCVFYNKDNSCQIVDMPIEPEGKCRFAIIPPGVVKGDFNMKKQYEFESEEDEDDYVSEFEFKYPGELLVAALRGVVGRKRRKKRKFKHLAEFGTYEDEMDPGKPYYLPVPPEAAFHVKQALDPIFDYHRAETYVDMEGIVITDGVSYELIDAIDTALDNLKKKDLIPEGLQVKVSGYRLGRAIGSRLVDRPGIGGNRRSARRFFTTPGAERFDPRTAVDRNLNGVVGEGIFLRGTPLEQPDPTPDGPGSINNPNMPGDRSPKIQPTTRGVTASGQESDYVREPAQQKPSSPDDYVREPARQKPSTREDYQLLSGPKKMPKAMQAAQAKNKEYANYLRTRESDRSLEDRIRFDGPYSVITREGKLSSGAGAGGLDALKPGDIVDTGTAEGRAVVEQYYSRMGEQIIGMLEEALRNPDKFKWNMPWRGGEHIPRNPTKRNKMQKSHAYQGSNYLLLNHIAQQRGYATNKWAGVTQWKKMKGKPKKNAQPVGVLTPILGSQPRQYKYELVYNVADIDGLPPKMYEPEIDLENLSPKARIQNAEEIVKELNPRVRESNIGGAYYSPSGDFINMPEFKTFENVEGYYATLLHEMTHWTSHPSRNNRKTGKWKTPAYAFEELIAEIGSSLLLGMIGISPRVREDHIAYLSGWLQSIKSDPNALRRAMTEAQQAVDFMLNRSATLRKLSGMEENERKAKRSVVDTVPLPMLEGYEDVPNVPKGSPITAGPAADIDERYIAETADDAFFSGLTYMDRDTNIRDMSDMQTRDQKEKFGGYTLEERMLAGAPISAVNDDRGRVMTLDGKFSSGGQPINPRQNSKAKPIDSTPATVDMAGLIGLAVPPTDEQRDIIDLGVAAAFGKEKIVVGVDAAAGSGKTTTMKALSAAIRAEFNVDELLDRFAGDNVSRKQMLVKKANYLVNKYKDANPNEVKAISDLITDNYENLDEQAMISAIRSLGEAYGVKRVERNGIAVTQTPSIYYTVFGREARLEAVDSFPGNTGIGTTTQVAYWSLRLGVAERDTPKNKTINRQSIARKMEISTEFGKRNSLPPKDGVAGKDRVETYRGYDKDSRSHDTAEVVMTGKTPNMQDLGYHQITDGKSMARFLADMGIQIKIEKHKIPVRKKGKLEQKEIDIVRLPFTVEVYRPTGSKGTSLVREDFVPAEDFMQFLSIAFRRWTLSADTEVTSNVFKLTPRELDDTSDNKPSWNRRKKKGETKPLDEQLDMSQVPQAWIDEMTSHVKAAADELIDGNGRVIPALDQSAKLLLLTDPDLSTLPGAVGQGTRDSLKDVKMPSQFNKKIRDIVYIGPNNLPYETVDRDGRRVAGRLWNQDEGDAFIITAVKGSRAEMNKIYASDERPLTVFAIDEAQDLNDIWEEMLKRNREKISLITVGDDRQQIMGFSGSKNIMQAVNPDFAPKLTQSFRFGSTLGYLATLILAKQNKLIGDMFNNGKPLTAEQWKYVEGAADTAAKKHIGNILSLVNSGDWAGANALNVIVRKLYGVDFSEWLNGEEFSKKTPGKQKKHITDLTKKLNDAAASVADSLRTRIVDEREEIFFGNLPSMQLSRGKTGPLDKGLGTYYELLLDSAVFLGGKVDDPNSLRQKPDITDDELDELIKPLEGKDKPRVSITQNAHAEAVAFFKHLKWAFAKDAGFDPGPKPDPSPLLGDRWEMSEIKPFLNWKASQTAKSLNNLMYSTQGGTRTMTNDPASMLLKLLGGTVTDSQGVRRHYSAEITPLRNSKDLALEDFTVEKISRIVRSTDRGQKSSGSDIAVAKIDVIPAGRDGSMERVYFALEHDFPNGQQDIREEDFEVIVEQIPGDPRERVRIISKWTKKDNKGVISPKFETIAEAGEGKSLDELKALAWQRMRSKLTRLSTNRAPAGSTLDPREKYYYERGLKWTGRIILTGDGVDTGRPGAVFADGRSVPNSGRQSNGIYLEDAIYTLDRLGLRDRVLPAFGVGIKTTRASGRDYDGFVIDVNGDEEEAAKVLTLISNSMRKLAKRRSGDVVIQTGTTAKGQESRYVMALDDFRDPGIDLTAQQIADAKAMGIAPPGWMEEMNLQHVVITRPMREVAIPGSLFAAHYADTPERKIIADLIRDGVQRGILPPDFDREQELADLPTKYKIIQQIVDEQGPAVSTWQPSELAAEIEDRRQKILLMADDNVRREMARIGVPGAVTERFLRRRQAVMDEYADSGLNEEELREAAVNQMRGRVLNDLNKGVFDPASGGWKQAEAYDGVSDAEVDVDEDGNPIVRDIDDILDEASESEMSGRESEPENVDSETDEDEDDNEVSGGPFAYSPAGYKLSSGAADGDSGDDNTDVEDVTTEEANAPKARRVRVNRTRSTPSGRFGRRMTRFENRSGLQQQLSAMELAGIRTDARLDPQDRSRAVDYAMRFWDGFDQVGIALDMPTDQDFGIRRRNAIINTLPEIGRRMQARRREDGSRVVSIGKTTDNAGLENPSSGNWMLSVAKLRDTIRIPSRWVRQEDRTRGDIVQETLDDGTEVDTRRARVGMYWTQSQPLSVANLRELLGLSVVEESKLNKENAGLSHDTVRYLLAEIGKQPEFSGWRLFAPVSDEEAEKMNMTPAERLVENIGRANMRDRFIAETFGADSYPFWHDRGDIFSRRESILEDASGDVRSSRGRMITPEQYRELEETDSTRRFNAVGKFENSPEAQDDSEAEVELAYEGTMGVSLTDIPVNIAREAPRRKTSQVDKGQLGLSQLLDYLGIPDETGWEKQLKPKLEASFGEGVDVGLGKDAVKSWRNDGVPVAYVQEMIRTGIIPNAREVWQSNKVGQKLDEELVAAKPQVYEALTEFIDRSFPDSAMNTSETRSFIINSREMPTILKNAAEKRGANFSKGTGDVPRFSRQELQTFVDRFNERFGTNHTIEDIFSHEQLRNAAKRLREGQTMFKPGKAGRKGTRKVSPTVANT